MDYLDFTKIRRLLRYARSDDHCATYKYNIPVSNIHRI